MLHVWSGGNPFTNKFQVDCWKTHIKGTSIQLCFNELYPSQTFVKTKWVLPNITAFIYNIIYSKPHAQHPF